MHIRIATQAKGKPAEVLAKFDQALLLRLKPPFTKMSFLRFDGSHPGDIVQIQVRMLWLIRQVWNNRISERVETPEAAWFTDEGVKLPMGIKNWRHKHLVEAIPGGCLIVDDLEFSTGSRWKDYFIYLPLRMMLAWRKPIYRKTFR